MSTTPKVTKTKRVKEPPKPTEIIWKEEYTDDMKWHYNGSSITEIPVGIIGFVYIIKNKVNGKLYIGKKNFFGTKIRQVNKKKVKEKCQSDFQDYYGSNDAIKADVIKYGKDQFYREIIVLCESKGMMSYYETAYQFKYNVISNPDQWYNGWIQCKIHYSHMKSHMYAHQMRDDLLKI